MIHGRRYQILYKQINDKIVGKRIASMRKHLNLTQKELASKLGIDSIYLSALEIGRRPLSREMMFELSNFFDVPISYWYEDFIKEHPEDFVYKVRKKRIVYDEYKIKVNYCSLLTLDEYNNTYANLYTNMNGTWWLKDIKEEGKAYAVEEDRIPMPHNVTDILGVYVVTHFDSPNNFLPGDSITIESDDVEYVNTVIGNGMMISKLWNLQNYSKDPKCNSYNDSLLDKEVRLYARRVYGYDCLAKSDSEGISRVNNQ